MSTILSFSDEAAWGAAGQGFPRRSCHRGAGTVVRTVQARHRFRPGPEPFIVTSPLLLLTMVVVKLLSRGPALYVQLRTGRSGRPFALYKIRSMHHQCEKNSGVQWSVPGDKRVFPLGRWLRRLHLDELPQLWNVIRGDMSLIGPRPERPEFVPQLEQAIRHYRQRLPDPSRRHGPGPGAIAARQRSAQRVASSWPTTCTIYGTSVFGSTFAFSRPRFARCSECRSPVIRLMFRVSQLRKSCWRSFTNLSSSA